MNRSVFSVLGKVVLFAIATSVSFQLNSMNQPTRKDDSNTFPQNIIENQNIFENVVTNGCDDTVKYLLESGCIKEKTLSEPGYHGWTVLHYAYHKLGCTELSSNCRNMKKATEKARKIVSLLIEHGAKEDIKDENKLTPKEVYEDLVYEK